MNIHCNLFFLPNIRIKIAQLDSFKAKNIDIASFILVSMIKTPPMQVRKKAPNKKDRILPFLWQRMPHIEKWQYT